MNDQRPASGGRTHPAANLHLRTRTARLLRPNAKIAPEPLKSHGLFELGFGVVVARSTEQPFVEKTPQNIQSIQENESLVGIARPSFWGILDSSPVTPAITRATHTRGGGHKHSKGDCWLTDKVVEAYQV